MQTTFVSSEWVYVSGRGWVAITPSVPENQFPKVGSEVTIDGNSYILSGLEYYRKFVTGEIGPVMGLCIRGERKALS